MSIKGFEIFDKIFGWTCWLPACARRSLQIVAVVTPLRTENMLATLSEGVKTTIRHVKAGTINWPMAIYITLVHVAGLIGATYIPLCHKYTLLWAFMLWPITKVCITAGYHRLWSHRSFKASLPVRIFLMLGVSIANQGTIWHWARDHRVHHKHSEVCTSHACLALLSFMH